jgi:basic membrane lipoprotein Med (substrate-binding protein (PBP1-ABC) superfamily)
MRIHAALVVLVVCAAAGCGGAKHTATTTAPATTRPVVPQGLSVGVVGPLDVRVAGATVSHGTLDGLATSSLVLVAAGSAELPTVAAAASANPGTHYALVGGTIHGERRPNLAGVVLRDDQAAFLGGVVAGLVAVEEGGTRPRIAWVGPQERRLTAAFGRGAHAIDAQVEILVALSNARSSACKEAALGATGRGAVVVMARGGPCADAALAGSHQANHVGLRLSDFELPAVAAAQIVRDAVAGMFHGGEDIVFGAASGVIGVRRLDPRISPTTAIAARTAAQDVASGRPPSR